MTRHRTIIALGLGALLVLGGRMTVAAVNTSPTVGIVRLPTFSNQVWPGDFNGDGITDLAGTAAVVPATATARVRVALGNGNGTFKAPVDTTFNGHVLAVADMNGDGKLDLIALGDPGPAPPLVILPGNGDGTFAAPVEVNVFDNLPFAAGVDMDGDGKRDLVLVNQDADRVLIFPGNGDFTFGAAVQLATASIPTGAIVTDLNGDGRRDIAVGSDLGHKVSVFVNKGSFLFTPSDIALDRTISDVTAGDVNGDGKVDLVASAYEGHEGIAGFESTAGFVYVMTGNGDGTFNLPTVYPVAPGAFAIVVGDFTRDGVVDVATGNRSAIVYDDCAPARKTWDSVSILPGNGNGTFAAASNFSVGDQSNIDSDDFRNDLWSLNTSDLNADRQTDLIVSGGVLFLNQAARANSAPTVTATSTQPVSGDRSIDLRAIASDADQDMLTYSWVDSGGTPIPPIPNYCFTPSTPGVHTFTVTVDDGHGNTARSSVTVDFGSGGGTSGTVSVIAPAQGEVVQGGPPYTVRWTASGDLSSVTRWSLSFTKDGTGFSPIAECSNVAADARSCTWNNPNPPTPGAQIIVSNRSSTNDISAISGVFAIAGPAGGVIGDGWAHADVGAVGAGGGATFDGFVRDGQAFTVSASGADIWGTADEFH